MKFIERWENWCYKPGAHKKHIGTVVQYNASICCPGPWVYLLLALDRYPFTLACLRSIHKSGLARSLLAHCVLFLATISASALSLTKLYKNKDMINCIVSAPCCCKSVTIVSYRSSSELGSQHGQLILNVCVNPSAILLVPSSVSLQF